MINESAFPIKVTTSDYEIISSGLVHIVESELKFELLKLVIKFKFSSDSEGVRLKAEVNENEELIINLFNFSNPLGEGKIEPLEIGTLSGRRLFCTFFVTTPQGDNLRQFNYTFMLFRA